MKNRIFLILILVISVSTDKLETQDKPEIFITSPPHEKIWFGTMPIMIELANQPADMPHTVEIYLDGRLIKGIKIPPYTFTYDFGKVPQNSSLKALLRVKNQVISSAEIKSFPIDDAQEVDVTQILVPVVVTDSLGNYISDLEKEDFILLEENKPQTINNFSKKGKTEFHLALLIDISSSMNDKIAAVKDAAKRFLKELLTKNDKAIVVFFNHEVFEDTEFSNDVKELSNSISMAFPFGATALYDAVGYCLKLFKGMPGLNTIILLSDGEENSSYLDHYTLLKKAEKSNTIIYAIGQKKITNNDKYQDILKKLTSSSGGMLFFIEDPAEIQKVYESIRNDIWAGYILEFSPNKNGKAKRYRQITVKLKNKKYSNRTIKGFYY